MGLRCKTEMPIDTNRWRWLACDNGAIYLMLANMSSRVDWTYVRVKGHWCYLYRALDSTGATIEFVLSGWRDAAAAKRLFRKALTDPRPQPRVINSD